ncbi:hypothetical protein P3T23_009551 [Paraburkholderia sp. GAS448]|jgi:hypothetical protein|uniref:hypothetical protein n=1 Tax=Paraburkholderia sp. GAS448 TaxID=3035136 RepID=UPI003D22273F
MQEQEYSAGIGDLKSLVGQRSREGDAQVADRVAFQWTPLRAIAGLSGALLLAWAFLHVILVLVFPRAVTLH